MFAGFYTTFFPPGFKDYHNVSAFLSDGVTAFCTFQNQLCVLFLQMHFVILFFSVLI